MSLPKMLLSVLIIHLLFNIELNHLILNSFVTGGGVAIVLILTHRDGGRSAIHRFDQSARGRLD